MIYKEKRISKVCITHYVSFSIYTIFQYILVRKSYVIPCKLEILIMPIYLIINENIVLNMTYITSTYISEMTIPIIKRSSCQIKKEEASLK